MQILSAIEAIIGLASKLIFIYLAIALGVLWRFSRFYREEVGKRFTQFTIWILFPINILVAILGIESIELSTLIGIGILAVLIHVVSYLSLVSIKRISRRNRIIDDNPSIGAQAMTATFPNALLYPFPIILATVGDQGLPFAAIFVFFVMILRNSLGVFIGVQHTEGNHEVGTSLDIQKIVIEVMKFPPFIATILGFAILVLIGPQDVQTPSVQLAKEFAIWGSLLLVGLSFQDLAQLKPNFLFSQKTLEVASVRFAVAPFFGLLFALFWRFPPLISFALMIQCMGPPAVANILYGRLFELPEDEISVYITSVTFLGLLLLPLEILVLSAIFPLN
ncbi:MAG: AEC family transporter [Candidatus Heimdallarchaeota archaeon]